jgi:hypothetical protein
VRLRLREACRRIVEALLSVVLAAEDEAIGSMVISKSIDIASATVAAVAIGISMDSSSAATVGAVFK